MQLALTGVPKRVFESFFMAQDNEPGPRLKIVPAETKETLPLEDRHDLAELPQLEVRARLTELRQEHRDMDAAIAALTESGRGDALRIQRLKKKKLVLKDAISRLEDALLPDIIA